MAQPRPPCHASPVDISGTCLDRNCPHFLTAPTMGIAPAPAAALPFPPPYPPTSYSSTPRHHYTSVGPDLWQFGQPPWATTWNPYWNGSTAPHWSVSAGPALESPKSPLLYTPDATPPSEAVENDLAYYERLIGQEKEQSPLQVPHFNPPATDQPASPSETGPFFPYDFKDLMTFLIKVFRRCSPQQTIYARFLEILGEFQMGKNSYEYTRGQVAELLKWAPDLVKEFEQLGRATDGIPQKETSRQGDRKAAKDDASVVFGETPQASVARAEGSVITEEFESDSQNANILLGNTVNDKDSDTSLGRSAKEHDRRSAGLSIGEIEIEFLYNCIDSPLVSVDDRLKAFGIISSLRSGRPAPNNGPMKATLAMPPNPRNKSTKEVIERVESILHAVDKASRYDIVELKDLVSTFARTLEDMRSQVDYQSQKENRSLSALNDHVDFLERRNEDLKDEIYEESMKRHELTNDFGGSVYRSWNLEGRMDALTDKFNAEFHNRSQPLENVNHGQNDVKLQQLEDKMNALDSKLTGVMNAYSELDHAQSDKITSLDNGAKAMHKDFQALQENFDTEARDPIKGLKASLASLADEYSRLNRKVDDDAYITDSRWKEISQSIESGDVDKRFVDAELQIENIKEEVKKISEPKKQFSQLEIDAKVELRKKQFEANKSNRTEPSGKPKYITHSIKSGDDDKRFVDVEFQMEKIKDKVKNVSDFIKTPAGQDLEMKTDSRLNQSATDKLNPNAPKSYAYAPKWRTTRPKFTLEEFRATREQEPARSTSPDTALMDELFKQTIRKDGGDRKVGVSERPIVYLARGKLPADLTKEGTSSDVEFLPDAPTRFKKPASSAAGQTD